jgi:hypothetical protein
MIINMNSDRCTISHRNYNTRVATEYTISNKVFIFQDRRYITVPPEAFSTLGGSDESAGSYIGGRGYAGLLHTLIPLSNLVGSHVDLH